MLNVGSFSHLRRSVDDVGLNIYIKQLNSHVGLYSNILSTHGSSRRVRSKVLMMC